MPQHYQPKTISEFGTLRVTDNTANAALGDDEGATIDNLNFTDSRTLVKRQGINTKLDPVVTTQAFPGGALTNPTSIRFLGMQRRAVSGASDRLFFTNLTKTELWGAFIFGANGTAWGPDTVVFRSPGPAAITGAEWMVEAATPAQPFQMQLIRSTGGPISITGPGVPGSPVTGPSGTHLTLFKDRLFAINSLHTSGQESRLYFTDAQNYTSWPANNFIDVAPANGEFCVCTVVFNDQLIVFKNKSTWVLTADGQPTSWVMRTLHPTIGCVGRGTPLIISGFVYFLSGDGVYRTDGTTFERISEPIDSTIKGLTSSLVSSSVLARDAVFYDDKYILLLPDTLGACDRAYVYDTRVQQWSRWMFGSGVDISGVVPYQEPTPPFLWLGHRTSPIAYYMGQFGNIPVDGTASNYTVNWQSKMLTHGEAMSYKRNYMVGLDVGPMSDELQNVTISHRKDATIPGVSHNPATVSGGSVTGYDQSRKLLKYKGAGYFRFLGISIVYVGSKKFELFSVTWQNEANDTVKQSS